MGSMYQMFAMDKNVERTGVYIEFGDFRIKIARAGGANENFRKVMQIRSKPVKRLIQTETITDKQANELMMGVYAQAVVLTWETKDKNGNFVTGIESEDGKLLDVTEENIVNTFRALPELYEEIVQAANRISLFKKVIDEADLKN